MLSLLVPVRDEDARERFHEMRLVFSIPVFWTGLGRGWTGVGSRPGLNEHVF
jgi:hypothetical protein